MRNNQYNCYNTFRTIDIDLRVKYQLDLVFIIKFKVSYPLESEIVVHFFFTLYYQFFMKIRIRNILWQFFFTFFTKFLQFFECSFAEISSQLWSKGKQEIACKDWGNLILAFWRWLNYKKYQESRLLSWKKLGDEDRETKQLLFRRNHIITSCIRSKKNHNTF